MMVTITTSVAMVTIITIIDILHHRLDDLLVGSHQIKAIIMPGADRSPPLLHHY